jgi:hypothetical protein
MDGRQLRERLTELAKTIPLDVGENPFANVMFHVKQLEYSINQIIQRADYQREKAALATEKLAMDKRAANKAKTDRYKAKKKAEDELELAGHDYVKPSSVEVKT